jgi:hypothetical protein
MKCRRFLGNIKNPVLLGFILNLVSRGFHGTLELAVREVFIVNKMLDAIRCMLLIEAFNREKVLRNPVKKICLAVFSHFVKHFGVIALKHCQHLLPALIIAEGGEKVKEVRI